MIKICKNCSKEYSTKDRRSKFCSRSCSAAFNNVGVNRHGDSNGHCKNCGNYLDRSIKKYCSSKCMQEYIFKCAMNDYIMLNKETSAKVIKRVLIFLHGNVCQECGIDSWNGKEIVMDLEHIDGNSQNNSFLNVTLLCPNCHSQTPTFKGKNNGNGRHSRRKRYADGKSY